MWTKPNNAFVLPASPNHRARAEIVTNLEAVGNELMAKAVEIETTRQRSHRKT
jgi:hypothetical protein